MFPFGSRKPFNPLESDAPAMLRKAGHTLRMTVSPLVAEIMTKELQPEQENFEAPVRLATLLETRADHIEAGLGEYNQRQGSITAVTRSKYIDISKDIEAALRAFAATSEKLKVPPGFSDFKQVAADKINGAMDEMDAALDAAHSIERILTTTARRTR